MRQQTFEAQHAAQWAELRLLLQRLEQGPGRRRRLPSELKLERLPQLLRTVSAHYALAQSRAYSPGMVEELQTLVRRGYRLLYRYRAHWLEQSVELMLAEFPRTLRRHVALFWLSCMLLFGPMLAMGLACAADQALIYSLIEPAQVADLESMYDSTRERLGRDAARQADSDIAMFGFYVLNNVGIAFRTFASGLLLGLGSLFFLGFNGLYIGAAAGHLTSLGHGASFWAFVSSHSAFELTAIAISGAAGLLLAKALLVPGRRTRLLALRSNALAAVHLVTGAMVMLLLAAAIEAFWSANPAIAPVLKYMAGALGWVLVIGYLGFAGRLDDADVYERERHEP